MTLPIQDIVDQPSKFLFFEMDMETMKDLLNEL